MRLTSIHIEDVPPIEHFHVDGLSEAVFIGGPNGAGKTRLLSSIIQFILRRKPSPNIRLTFEITCEEELASWGKDSLETANPDDLQTLRGALQAGQHRKWKSGIIYFESNRELKKVTPLQFSWSLPNPYTENVSWDMTLSGLQHRWQDTMHAIFRLIEHRRRQIADRGEDLLQRGAREMSLEDFSDPIEPFRSVFAQLFRPKTLDSIDLVKQIVWYNSGNQRLHIDTLSAGEKEVLGMVFDFTVRTPTDCIVLFDEPELHLHLELAQSLVQTLRSIGARNQFIFCTHSPQLISSSLDDTVVFLGPASEDHQNQAIVVKEGDQADAALSLLGHSIGIISLGRRIVLIEGDHSSLDKKVYDGIVRRDFPEFVLVPSEGRDLIANFALVHEKILSRTLWGAEFFMLCDHDASPNDPKELLDAQRRMRRLERYHLENYFLEEGLLAEIFRSIAIENSDLHTADGVRATLVGMAERMISYATALHVAAAVRQRVGNISLKRKQSHGLSVDELADLFRASILHEKERVGGELDEDRVVAEVESTFAELTKCLKDDSWKLKVPGRPIVGMLAERAGCTAGQIKNLYLKYADNSDRDPFAEIREIFGGFREEATPALSSMATSKELRD